MISPFPQKTQVLLIIKKIEKFLQNIKNPILLLGSKKLLTKQMVALKYKFKVEEIYLDNINFSKINNKYKYL